MTLWLSDRDSMRTVEKSCRSNPSIPTRGRIGVIINHLFRSLGSRYTRTVESITMNKAKIALTPANGAQRRA